MYADLLRYLATHPNPDDRTGPKLGHVFLNDPEESIRSKIGRIRSLLDEYFNGEGRKEKFRISIAKGQADHYAVTFPPNFPTGFFVEKFWAPYLTQQNNFGENSDSDLIQEEPTEPSKTVILYTEPRFFRLKGYYVRVLPILDGDDQEKIDRKLPLELQDLVEEQMEVRQYVSAGESSCVLTLSRWLERNGVLTVPAVAHKQRDWGKVGECNGIAIGNFRTNWAIEKLQAKPNDWTFTITPDSIVNSDVQGKEHAVYEDEQNRSLPDRLAYWTSHETPQERTVHHGHCRQPGAGI